jgi:hypothetical protein
LVITIRDGCASELVTADVESRRIGRPFGSDRLGWSSAKRLQEVAEPGVSNEYRMGPSHVRLRFGEELVVAQVGIACVSTKNV